MKFVFYPAPVLAQLICNTGLVDVTILNKTCEILNEFIVPQIHLNRSIDKRRVKFPEPPHMIWYCHVVLITPRDGF
jgi:hypothetical protein